jgi:polar amino acid transport system substrate-binding protein
MTWTRRDFLRVSTVVTVTGVSAGCVAEVAGAPKADPNAEPEPTDDPTGGPVRMAVLEGEPDAFTDDSGEVTGQVPEVARAVLERLGKSDVEIELVDEPAKAFTMLAAGMIDLVGGLAVQPEQCDNVDFSVPDHVLLNALLVPTGNPKGLSTLADVAGSGARVALLSDGRSMEVAQRAGIPQGQLIELSYDTLAEAVATGQVDCAFWLEVALKPMAENAQGRVEVTEPFTPPGEQPLIVAFGFPHDSDLVEDFNDTLRELQDSGEWERLSKPFGYTKDALPDSDVSVEKACGS